MARSEFLFVICYDVVKDRARNKVAGALESVAVRVQDSVFEMRATRDKVLKLSERLAGLLDDGDSLRVYAIHDSALQHSWSIGDPPISEAQEFYLL